MVCAHRLTVIKADAFIFAQIPGTAPAPVNKAGPGFWTFPCNATLNPIHLNFGNHKYAMSPEDFSLGQLEKLVRHLSFV